MLGWLKANSTRRSGQQIYERIVAAARAPALYESCGVPDTMDGRLEMLLLHTVLVLDRLRSEGAAGQRVGQRLMESLVADTDDALRQIGLGDDSVTPRMQRLAGALQERARDYGAALSAPAGELEAALLRHVSGAPEAAPAAHDQLAAAARLADYARRAKAALAVAMPAALLVGEARFPPVIAAPASGMEIAT